MIQEQLKKSIADTLPDWQVTINEAYMVNIQADDIARFKGFAYIEEYDTQNVDWSKYGKRIKSHEEVYFCLFCELDVTAEMRVSMRTNLIMPSVEKVEKMLRDEYSVQTISRDVYPRGFDGNEIVVHIAFDVEEQVCQPR